MRQPIDRSAISIMILACIVWGSQQTAIKAIATDISPLLQIGIRFGLAALFLWLANRFFLKQVWSHSDSWRVGILAGFLFGLEFLFMGLGLRWTTASHMSVLLYTAPLFAAIGLHLRVEDERLTLTQWGGMGLAFLGIAIIFLLPELLHHSAGESGQQLFGDFLGLMAGAAWGMTTITVRSTRLSKMPASQTLFYQLIGGCVLPIVISLILHQAVFIPTLKVISILAYQTIFVAVGSYLTWFWLLKRYQASQLGILLFMTPIFGVLISLLFLGERLTLSLALGGTLTILGMVVVTVSSRKVRK